MKIGVMELIVIFIVALVVLGPDKLPEYARKLGSALGEFRKATTTLTSDIKEGVVAPLEEAQEPLRQAVEPLDDLRNEVKGEWKEVETSLNDLGRPGKASKAASAAARQEPAPADPSAQPEPPAAPAEDAPAQNP
ncbi:MAG: twin-arginine translocase TatA/TatE family subunit [Clostridiales bacterium]|nr:twin-arginine translocase TatA/TatE family subunit [Clostridiales bacterium]MCD8367895.1 twin-arginine translocase TatA/TatE family subunit [Clostridiales bacterium]